MSTVIKPNNLLIQEINCWEVRIMIPTDYFVQPWNNLGIHPRRAKKALQPK